MKKILAIALGILFLSSVLYSIPSHPSDPSYSGYNVRIDSPWSASNSDLGAWHLNQGETNASGVVDWANYECWGIGTECRDDDWITLWKPSVTPPPPGISGYYQTFNYPSFPSHFDPSNGIYF